MSTIYDICSLLQIPVEFAKAYESNGLKTLYPWQVECIMTYLNDSSHRNLLYCAPTSGGKSLVAELFLLRAAITNNQKVLLVLPYVSMVIEKQKYFKRLIRFYNRNQPKKLRIKIRGVFGDKGGYNIHQDRIFISTIEKGNRIFNDIATAMLSKDALSDNDRRKISLGCVVVDEMHNIGGDFNGYLLEILMSKVLMLATLYTNMRLIAMSATVSNIHELAAWAEGCSYITDYRPVPLQELIVAGNYVLQPDTGAIIRPVIPSIINTTPNDVISALCNEAISNHQQILIFCPTKKDCSDCCQQLADMMQRSQDNSGTSNIYASIFSKERDAKSIEKLMADRRLLQEALLKCGQSTFHTMLGISVLWGVAFHNANLGSKERELIEKAYKIGVLNILTATSTLAAGVNLPAGCVIIRSLSLGKDTLGVMHYRQMSGRAGRAGQADRGISYLVVKPHEKEAALALVRASYPRVISRLDVQLDGGNAILKAIIEVISLNLCLTTYDIIMFLSKSLFYHQQRELCNPDKQSNDCIQHLISSMIIHVEKLPGSEVISLTRFGKAMVRCNMDPDEAVVYYEALVRAREGLILDVPLHIMYLITPLDKHGAILYPNFKKLLDIYEQSNRSSEKRLKRVFDAVGADYPTLAGWSVRPPSKQMLDTCFDRVKRRHMVDETMVGVHANMSRMSDDSWTSLCCCLRLWLALITTLYVEGRSVESMSNEFQCTAHDLSNLRLHTIMTASTVKRLCVEIGWTPLARLIDNFKKSTLSPNESDEMRELLQLNAFRGKEILTEKAAKMLYESGINSIQDLSCRSVDNIIKLFDLRQGFEPKMVIPTPRHTVTLLVEAVDVNAPANDSNPPVARFRQWIFDLLDTAKKFASAQEVLTNQQAEELTNALDQLGIDADQQNDLFLDSDSSNDGLSDDDDDDLEMLAKDSDSEDSFDMNDAWEPLAEEDIDELAVYDNDSDDEDELVEDKNYDSTPTEPSVMIESMVDDELENKICASPPAKIMRRSLDRDSFLAEAMEVAAAVNDHVIFNPISSTPDHHQYQHQHPDETRLSYPHPPGHIYQQSRSTSPVKYLYYPQLDYDHNNDVVAINNNIESKASFITAADVANQLNSFALRLLTIPSDCDFFLAALSTTRCMSMEFLFRRIPSPLHKSREAFTRWQPYVAWNCPKTSSAAYGGVTMNTKIASLDPDDRAMGQDPHILAGVGINFGDIYSYYLPLPCPLPLLLPFDSMQRTPSHPSSPLAHHQYIGDDLFAQRYPDVMDAICAFVGFDSLLMRCQGLHQLYHNQPSLPNISIINHRDPRCYNGLSIVSKNWARSYRRALLRTWEEKRCMEWRLLGDIMSNKMITKVAIHVKSKLVTLLGRNIIVEGQIQDPTVASMILSSYGIKIDAVNREMNLPPVRPIAISASSVTTSSASSSHNNHLAIRRAAYRATETMRIMARYERMLQQASPSAYDLFTNVEMPICRCIAEMEFHGILINTPFYYNLRQDLQDRKLMIEHNIRDILYKGFNPESSPDIKRLNEILSVAMSAEQHPKYDPRNIIKNESWDDKHPVKAMMKEHRSVAIMALPQASGLLEFMMRTDAGDRVSAFFDQFGTPTGRIIASNPSLQCAVKSFYYVPVERWSLADEVCHWESDPQLQPQLDSLLQRLARGEKERIRVINKSRNVRYSLDQSTLELYDGFTLGELISLERIQPATSSKRRSKSSKTKKLLQSWKAMVQYRHSYATASPHPLGPQQVSIRQIIRLGAPMSPNGNETDSLRDSMSRPLSYLYDDDLYKDHVSKQRHVKFREGFIAAPGYALIAADYSQFELRVLAHFCKDPSLCAAFHSDEDVFESIAAIWLKKDVAAVTKDERNLVKQICYKKIYGAGPESIADDLGISMSDAKEKMEDFMKSYPMIDTFIKNTLSSCRSTGYVDSLLGRRLYYHNMKHENWKIRGKDERAAVNFVCQSSAADIIKMAMINIHYQLQHALSSHTGASDDHSIGSSRCPRGPQTRSERARLVHMIHDELLYEVRIDDVEQVAAILKSCMENCVQLRVPLKANLKLGSTWGSTIPYSEYIDRLLHRTPASTSMPAPSSAMRRRSMRPSLTPVRAMIPSSSPHSHTNQSNSTLLSPHVNAMHMHVDEDKNNNDARTMYDTGTRCASSRNPGKQIVFNFHITSPGDDNNSNAMDEPHLP